MTFADLCTVVESLLPGRYVTVKVERNRSSCAVTYSWQIYTETHSWGPTCATADEAIAQLREAIAGNAEQKVDPIEITPIPPPAPQEKPGVDIPF